MDLSNAIRELDAEKQRLEQAIALLEQLQRSEDNSTAARKPARRERKTPETPQQL